VKIMKYQLPPPDPEGHFCDLLMDRVLKILHVDVLPMTHYIVAWAAVNPVPERDRKPHRIYMIPDGLEVDVHVPLTKHVNTFTMIHPLSGQMMCFHAFDGGPVKS